jgi:hypothetical protein
MVNTTIGNLIGAGVMLHVAGKVLRKPKRKSRRKKK